MTTNAPASKQRAAISGPLSWSSIGTKRGELEGAKFSGKPTARTVSYTHLTLPTKA